MVATRYEEIVVKRVFPGKEPLNTALRLLVEAAGQVLEMDEGKRRRTILRVEVDGRNLQQVNWILERGSHFHEKDCSTWRAEKLAASAQE